jgi:transposase
MVDFSGRVGHDEFMYIRQTKTSNATSGGIYYTFRLVSSERIAGKVRQQTLLNLGRNFSLPQEQWRDLCTRIEQILSGQGTLLQPVSKTIETMAQRYAAQLVVGHKPVASSTTSETAQEYHEVDVESLELVRPRSVGVEHVGLAALGWLELPHIFAEAGFNGVQQAAVMASVIGRMAAPGSELATWRWLTKRSALGELLEVDFEAMSQMSLYRASDLLVKHRPNIETKLFSRINDLFSLPTTVTLYDLTNTYFEGEMAGNDKARRGHSKEKRSDCPLVTLGLVLDGSGFVRRSRMFAGNASESTTLAEMLQGLDAPRGALVIMDRGVATEANVAWLVEHHYRYLVVSRERGRQFDEEQSVAISTASDQTVRIQRVVSDDGAEVRLYCHSEARQAKEAAMSSRFIEKFEGGLTKLAAGLMKPRGEKKRDKILLRIGRLQEQSHGIGQHYSITLTPDETGAKVTGLSWGKTPVDGSQLTHPGIYCLRTNELNMDEASLWQTYTMLTDLEAVFRSLKSELGMRPVYHHKEDRADGHLFITVLAYQAVQALRQKLKAQGINKSWKSLREIFSMQQRVTATFKQKDGRTLHIRKSTLAEPKLQKLYDALGLPSSPGRMSKLVN